MSLTAARQADHPKISGAFPAARVRKSRLTWLLWLIPAGAVAICFWFVYRDYISAGPLITIYFQDASGLEEENTQVTYRGATVGVVKSVAITKDNKSVAVTARLAGSAKQLAREGSVFWIVRPELKVGAISGLRTIVSGEYVEVQPGSGAATNTFVGADKPPLPAEPGSLAITLLTPSLGSLQEQSPVFYRGLRVGEVTYYQLASDAHEVKVHARIWQEYAPLVRVNSQFWNAGGIDVHLGLFKGMQLTAESPKTLFSGGIEFATPPDYLAAAPSDAVFVLNEKPDDKWKTWIATIKLNLPPEAVQTNKSVASFLK